MSKFGWGLVFAGLVLLGISPFTSVLLWLAAVPMAALGGEIIRRSNLCTN